MAFKSYDELILMANKDPKLARAQVAKAKKSNSPVVDSDNSGYSGAQDKPAGVSGTRYQAIYRRLNQNTPKEENPRATKKSPRVSTGNKKRFETAIQRRLKSSSSNPMTPPVKSREEEIVTQRKKLGY